MTMLRAPPEGRLDGRGDVLRFGAMRLRANRGINVYTEV
jgi:hypothetical protein